VTLGQTPCHDTTPAPGCRRIPGLLPSLRGLLAALVLTVIASALGLGASSAAAQGVVSTFDTDLDGWVILGDNGAVWQGAGGNPGGYMDVNDLVTGQLNLAAAPPKFLGDWSAFSATDTLSFDVHFIRLSGTTLTNDWIFRITGPGGAARGIVPGVAPPESVWSTYAVPMDSTDWVMESGSWSGLVGNVTSLNLLAEYVNGDEEVRIDNVRLTGTPVAVFTPCTYSEFNGTGLDNWSFQGTGSTSNPENGDGNRGGFMQVSDRTSTEGYAFAPSRFLGDWSSLDGDGRVTVDVRILTSTGTNLGSPEFLRLSGPGGSAHVAVDASDLPNNSRVWKKFTFVLDPAVWTVDSGSWSALLASVTECRLDTDFYSGGGTCGFDNFGRLGAGCPPVDDAVTVHAAGISRCAVLSLIGPGGIALNPHDGALYALSRNQGSPDGVYVLTGPDAVTRLRSYSIPAGLLFDEDGDGYVTEDYSGNIYRFVGADSSSVWVSGLHSGDDDPFGMALAPAGFSGANVDPGDIVVADRGSGGPDQLWTFSPDAPENERLLTPDPGNVDWFDLAPASDSTLWMSDAFSDNALFLVSPDGAVTSFPLNSPIGAPVSIASDPLDGSVYVGSSTDLAVYRVDPGTGDVTLVADGFVQLGITGIEIGAATRRLWVADNGANRVYEFCLPGLTGVGDITARPAGPALAAYPNPFGPAVRLSFRIEAPAEVSLAVFDVAGRRVRTLVEGRLDAGSYAFRWDGMGDGGARAASGIYFGRLSRDGVPAVRRLVYVR